MATQEQKTNERQEKREPQSAALARLGGYDPFGFFLNPYSWMRRMTEEMDRALGPSGFVPGIAGAAWMPAIEISERDGKYMVRGDLARHGFAARQDHGKHLVRFHALDRRPRHADFAQELALEGELSAVLLDDVAGEDVAVLQHHLVRPKKRRQGQQQGAKFRMGKGAC